MPRGYHRSDPPEDAEPFPPPRRRRRWLSAVSIFGLLALLVGTAVGVAALHRHRTALASDTSGSTLFGVAASSVGPLATATAEFGHMPIIRVYYPGLPNPNAWTSGAPGINKSAVVVSFKATPAAILSGSDDAALSKFFDGAPRTHPIYYSYYIEPEIHIAHGDFSLADYKAAWQHIVTLADAANNSDLHSTLILTSYDLSPSSHRNWQDYLPSGKVISVLAWDAYPAGSVEDVNPQATPPGSFMGPEIAAAKSVGLPYGFAEFGLATSNGRPAWLTDVGSYLARSGALFGTYFQSAGWPDMELTDSSSITAWKGVINGSGLSTAPPSPAPSTSAPTPTSSLAISGLAASPSSVTPGSGHPAKLSFSLSEAANVTICVLGADGQVIRQLARPGLAAGSDTVSYYGWDNAGHQVPVGSYQALVVASNAHGSATAEVTITVTQ